MAWIGPAISAGSALIGGKSGKGAQQQESAAAQQAANAMSQLFGAESSDIDQLMKSYFGPGGAGQTMQQLTPQLLGWLQHPMTDPAVGSLVNQLAQTGGSAVRTLQGDMGSGTANPGMLATRLFGQANDAAAQGGANLMGQLQGQNLGALNNIFGTQAGLLDQGLGGMQSMANTYGQLGMFDANMAAGQGSPWGNALGGLAGAANSLWGAGGPWAGMSTGGGSPYGGGTGAPMTGFPGSLGSPFSGNSTGVTAPPGTPGGYGPQP